MKIGTIKTDFIIFYRLVSTYKIVKVYNQNWTIYRLFCYDKLVRKN